MVNFHDLFIAALDAVLMDFSAVAGVVEYENDGTVGGTDEGIEIHHAHNAFGLESGPVWFRLRPLIELAHGQNLLGAAKRTVSVIEDC